MKAEVISNTELKLWRLRQTSATAAHFSITVARAEGDWCLRISDATRELVWKKKWRNVFRFKRFYCLHRYPSLTTTFNLNSIEDGITASKRFNWEKIYSFYLTFSRFKHFCIKTNLCNSNYRNSLSGASYNCHSLSLLTSLNRFVTRRMLGARTFLSDFIQERLRNSLKEKYNCLIRPR